MLKRAIQSVNVNVTKQKKRQRVSGRFVPGLWAQAPNGFSGGFIRVEQAGDCYKLFDRFITILGGGQKNLKWSSMFANKFHGMQFSGMFVFSPNFSNFE